MKQHTSKAGRLGILATLFFILLLTAGCHKKTPNPIPHSPTPVPTWTVTPTPTRQYTPKPSPTATATTLPTPTSNAVQNTPAPSPLPPPTPTPTATPFPPGPRSKLGVFVGRNDPQLFELLRTGNLAVVKTTEYDPNFVSEIKAIDPDVFLVARLGEIPQVDLNNWDPIAEAHKFVQTLLPIATEPRRMAAIDCWEAYNEPVPANEAQMASLAQFEAERVRLLAQAGIRSCIGNFSMGHPDLALWPAFFPALQAAKENGGYLALHEYSRPYMWSDTNVPPAHNPAAAAEHEGWLTLRYRKVYREYLQPAGLDIPLVITETGIDGPPPDTNHGSGWQGFTDLWRSQGMVRNTDFGFYMEQLAWYDAELQKDDYVIGAAIFTLAGTAGWESYEIGGPWLEIFKQYLSVHPPH